MSGTYSVAQIKRAMFGGVFSLEFVYFKFRLGIGRSQGKYLAIWGRGKWGQEKDGVRTGVFQCKLVEFSGFCWISGCSKSVAFTLKTKISVPDLKDYRYLKEAEFYLSD